MALGFGDVVGADHVALFEDLGRPRRARDRQRAPVRGAGQRRAHAPALAAAAGAARRPGHRACGALHPAGEGNEVGGDFYDCFRTGDGEWAVVIGDVCGKGAEAAAVTALARYTVRASATLHSESPGVARGPQRRHPPRIPTAVLHRALRLAVAARRPRHRLRRVGRAPAAARPARRRPRQTTGLPGTLLGILPDPEIRPQKLVLRPGDSLILYTDGVI